MKTSRAIGVLCAVVLLGLTVAGPADAMFLTRFKANSADLSFSGKIEFSGPTTATGQVTSFDVSGMTFGHEWTCSGLNCLQLAEWEILPGGELDQLFFRTIEFPTQTVGVDVDLLFDLFGSSISECEDFLSSRCPITDLILFRSQAFAPRSFATVPEPTGLVLFTTGMVGLLVFGGRRRKGLATR